MSYVTLALDLGTTTGYAIGSLGVRYDLECTSGSVTFHYEKVEFGQFWSLFHTWLDHQLFDFKVDEIIYECSIHQQGNAARVINSLVCLVELVAYNRRIRTRGCHQSTLKKFATGTGKHKKGMSKLEMKRAAKKRWPKKQFADDNHIDALFLLDFARTNPV